jgi:hypothetical protein
VRRGGLFEPALVDPAMLARSGGFCPSYGARRRIDDRLRLRLLKGLLAGFGDRHGEVNRRSRNRGLPRLDGPVSREEAGEHGGEEKQKFQAAGSGCGAHLERSSIAT